MNTAFVVVVVALVVVVVTAAGALLRSIAASPTREYRRSLRGIRQYREEIDSRAATSLDTTHDVFPQWRE